MMEARSAIFKPLTRLSSLTFMALVLFFFLRKQIIIINEGDWRAMYNTMKTSGSETADVYKLVGSMICKKHVQFDQVMWKGQLNKSNICIHWDGSNDHVPSVCHVDSLEMGVSH